MRGLGVLGVFCAWFWIMTVLSIYFAPQQVAFWFILGVLSNIMIGIMITVRSVGKRIHKRLGEPDYREILR